MEIVHLILGKANPDRMNGVNKVVYQLATYQTIAKKKVTELQKIPYMIMEKEILKQNYFKLIRIHLKSINSSRKD
jgi:hypothetical protein